MITVHHLDGSRPHLMKYLDTIHARPADRRATERGGAYAYVSST